MYDELDMGEERDPFIEELKMSSKDLMMDMIYRALINNEMGALKSEASLKDKIEAISTVINHYVMKEEYEKCHELKKIIYKLQC